MVFPVKGIIGVTMSVAKEYTVMNIAANAIATGFIRSAIFTYSVYKLGIVRRRQPVLDGLEHSFHVRMTVPVEFLITRTKPV